MWPATALAPASSPISPGSTARISSYPRRITRRLSSTTAAPSFPNFRSIWLRMPAKSVSSLSPSRSASGETWKKAPMKAAPCIR
jgi:hypothetical protein